eukprot:5613599-Alexandrium_andersonii.AAC.1
MIGLLYLFCLRAGRGNGPSGFRSSFERLPGPVLELEHRPEARAGLDSIDRKAHTGTSRCEM